jgi:hypothetical protein
MKGELSVVSGQWLVGKDVSAPDQAGFFLGFDECIQRRLIGHHAFPTHHSPLTTSGGLPQ